MSIIKNTMVEHVVYWILNIISPSINAQAIITYILAQKSRFCQLFAGELTIFTPIGNDTMAINWILLFLHIIILLSLLIALGMGLLKFSFLCRSYSLPFDDSALDNDVVAERRRILSLNPSVNNKYPVNTVNNEERYEADHLTVHDLVKRFRGRNVNAVNHLTFGAKRGEAFGLLGYNVSYIKIFKKFNI